MAFKPLQLDDLGDPYIRGAIYGGNGVGKSILACTSQLFRVFHFDVDDGSASIRAYINKYNLRRDLYQGCRVTDQETFLTGYNWLVANIETYRNQLVVIDTASELQRILARKIAAARGRSWLDQKDWGTVLTTCEDITTSFRWLPCHVLFLCHESTVIRDNDRPFLRPSFKGAFAEEYGKHFSWIARYFVFDQQTKDATGQIQTATSRWLNCQRDQFTDAKDRSMSLEKYEAPSLDVLIPKMISAIQSQGGR